MNIISKAFKPNTFGITFLSACACLSLSAVAYEKKLTPSYQSIPAVSGVASLHIESSTSGSAVIVFDRHTIDVSFDFERIDDDFGVPGTEFVNAEIVNLSIDHVADGHYPVRDFTTHQDHIDINAMLVAYMIKHRLLEV